MIVMPEIDLTPETAQALSRFRSLFLTGRFLWVSGFGAEALGVTDMQVLYRAMDRVLLTASGQELCSVPSSLTPQEALAQAQSSAAELKTLLEQLKGRALEWYGAQDADTQVAVLALLASLRAWVGSVVNDASPETQAVLEALKSLILTIEGEAHDLERIRRGSREAGQGTGRG